MNFHSPQAFILLILIPIYLYINKSVVSQKGLPFPDLSFLKNNKIGLKANLYQFTLPLRLSILLLLIIALARPQYSFEKKENKVKGIDIILSVDTSKSMLAEDLKPKNRLESSKEVISEFIKMQTTNRLGLIVFSGKSFTLSPLTLDYDILLLLLKEITVNSVKVDGTAIGEAISNSIYRFNYEKPRNKVLILLTDGENNAGKIEPQKAAEIAKIKGVKIYTIGVGKPEGAPIPLINPYTGEKNYAQDINGNILLSKINETELIEIATKTGGAYFRAVDKGSLNKIYKKIDLLEKTEITSKVYTVYQEKYKIFLLISLILMLLDFLLNKFILNPVRI
jgi:Ca-activated chloride channel family protein